MFLKYTALKEKGEQNDFCKSFLTLSKHFEFT